jgi:hypothetical protein
MVILMILRNLRKKKRVFNAMALLVISIMLAMTAACAPPLETSASPSPTQDTEPLMPEASASASSGPFVSPNASPKAPVPTSSPDKEANLYILGVYISKPAYVDAITGETMLPMQESLQALGISYSSAADNSIELMQHGKELAKIAPVSDFEYELIMADEEQIFEGNLYLQRRGSALYAPIYFFEFIDEVDASSNSYGDIFLSKRPESSPSPSPSPSDEPADQV